MAIIDELSGYCGLEKDNIELTASSDYGHEIVLKWLFNERREAKILVFTPTYDNFRSTAQAYFDEVRLVNLGVDNYNSCLHLDLSGWDLIYLSNPNNPTTDFLDAASLQENVERFPNTMFLVDEAYIDFDMHKSVKDLIRLYPNIIISRTFSKAFGLAAFRVGYFVGDKALVAELARYNNVKYVNAFAKIAVHHSLKNIHEIVANISLIKQNMMSLEKVMKKSSYFKRVKSGGGNFILVECYNPDELLSLLENNSIYVRSLSHLSGMKNWIRITVPARGLERIISLL